MLAEVKGITAEGLQPGSASNRSSMARPVSLSAPRLWYRALTACSTASMEYRSSSRGTSSRTVMPGSVMVPVLSTHSTSTRARVSMQFMSWARVFFWARRIMLTARATLVRR